MYGHLTGTPLRIEKFDWLWVFEKRNHTALVISTLEALAVLVALELYFGEEANAHQLKVMVVPTWTDNRGTGAVLIKLMTTKFPASAFLMDMSACMKRMNLRP